MDKNTKNLVTIRHGSHLYGLARPDSDIDLYTIYDFLHQNYRPKKQAEQEIEGETDSFKISLDKFCEQVEKGVPQALEALFAREQFFLDVDGNWGADISEGLRKHIYRNNFNLDNAMDTYRRTIISFFREDDFKKNRHGFRLLLNAADLKRAKVFDPTLDNQDIDYVNEWAEYNWARRQDRFKDTLWAVFN